jgi:hypothetical protein
MMLFVELALIAGRALNVIYLAYFSNFVLLGSFLGIGIGFLRARAPDRLFNYAPIALAFFVGFVLIFPSRSIARGVGTSSTSVVPANGLAAWLTLPVILRGGGPR